MSASHFCSEFLPALKSVYEESPAVTQQKGNQERKDVPTVEAQKLLTA